VSVRSQNSRLILIGNRPEGLIQTVEEEHKIGEHQNILKKVYLFRLLTFEMRKEMNKIQKQMRGQP
jgi:hypothetical protein